MNGQKTYSREHKCKIFFRNSIKASFLVYFKFVRQTLTRLLNIMFYDKIRIVFLVLAYLDLVLIVCYFYVL